MRRFVSFFTVISAFANIASAEDRTCWLRNGSAPARDTVYLLCEQGAVVVTTDGGATWTNRPTSAKAHLRAVAFTDVSHGVAAGDGGLVLATSDSGKTWQTRTTGVKENLAAVAFVGQQGWVVGFDGVILHTTDGGQTWTPQETGTKESLEGIFFLDADHGWAVGWAGTILRTADGGKKWQIIHSDAAQWSLSAVYFRNANDGWIVGFSGQILRSTDGGATWKTQKSPVNNWLSSVAFDRSNRGWIAADDKLLVTDDGETWRAIPVEEQLFVAQMLPVGDSLWAIGQLGVLKSTGDLTKWKRIESLVTDDPGHDTTDAAAH
jgi:photosystem II stability/assembly factor-like uncharacterized protein